MRPSLNPFFGTISKKENQLFSIELLAEYLECQEDACRKPHVHEHTEILWILEGSGKLHLDLQMLELETGNMYFIKPGEVHRLQCEPDARGYLISLPFRLPENAGIETDPDFQFDFMHFIQEQKALRVGEHLQEDMQDILERMKKEIIKPRGCSNEILFRYFNIFLFYLKSPLAESSKQITQSRNNQVLQQFKDLVNKHYKTKKMVSDYASEMNLTPNYLNEIIKKTTGHSAGYFIRQRIVLEAKRYALHSGVCMKEIGYHLGFSDMAHFSKFFKSAAGSNFTDFKNARMNYAING